MQLYSFLSFFKDSAVRFSSLLHLPFLILFSLPVAAQFTAGSDGGKTIEIPRLSGEVSIDGVLDDDLWSRALLINDFHQYEPVEYAEPSQKTEIWIFYTEEALYVASRFWETDPELINANVLRQGQSLQSDDLLAVILDPYLDRRNGYRFEVNPNGVRWEGLFQNITNVEGSWDGIWQANASSDETGWYSEMRIPFQTISFNPDSDSWGINFRRAIRRGNESIAWVSRNRQVNPSIAGTITGLENLQQGKGLDIVPSMVLRKDRVIAPGGLTEESFEPQLDVFYKITPQLNAALTINTDFSATEVDSRQVNLTRFSLFFPEKRDFFIRDSDIFEFGQIGGGGFDQGRGAGNPAVPGAATQNARPFFSRRIGLSTGGEPVDINAGVKVSGRVGDWNVGTLLISQDEDVLSGVDSSEVFVGRAILNVLGESQLGVIATSGDPQSNLDNNLMGMDFRYRNSRLPGGRTIQGVAFYQQSDTAGKTGDDASYGFGISSPNNQGWRGGYNYKRVEKNFDPAVGFVSLTDMEDHAVDFGYRHFYRPGGFMRSTYVGFDGYESRNLSDGDVISSNLGLRITNNNNSGDGLFGRLMKSREVLRRDFTINRSSDGNRQIVIPAGDYSYNEYLIGLQLGNQRALSGRISTRFGDYYNGTRFQRGVGMNWRPTRQYDIGVNFTETEIELPVGNFTVRLFTLDTKIAFSSTLAWSNLLQYDNVSEVMGFNSRLHWIPEAGKQAFLVFNYGLADLDKDNEFHSTGSDISLKFSYTFRF
ncbi:MAG: carbohydrate binding family 9 domain-containing protein [Gammaproteobacteria bacterium]|jgi:hypothetical protein|nr:carbohydrate binding family 9 domain-containing protein [Gammaproteobacteria bacterium]